MSAQTERRPHATDESPPFFSPFLGVLLAGLMLSAVLALTAGAVAIPPERILTLILRGVASSVAPDGEPRSLEETVLLTIRLPRLFLAMTVGATLAVSGAVMQGVFRNPLADPALIGISSGAAVGAAMVIVLDGHILGAASVPLGAFGGGLAATMLVQCFAAGGNTSALILSGIAINALAGAVIGLFIYLADDQQLRSLTFWSMGSLGGATWPKLWIALPAMMPTLLLLPFFARALNALLLGETEARHLGFPVMRLKRSLIALVALGVGAAVAMTGIIGFVGLAAPHLVRLAMGPDHRSLLPASALAGAVLLTLADTGARTLAAPAELPIGILTGLLGGPFFLWLLRRQPGYR